MAQAGDTMSLTTTLSMYLNFIIRKSERRNKQSVKTYSMDCGVGISRHHLRSGIWNEGVCSKQPVSPGNRANQVHLELVNTRGRIKPLRLKNLWLGERRGGRRGENEVQSWGMKWVSSIMHAHAQNAEAGKKENNNKQKRPIITTTTNFYYLLSSWSSSSWRSWGRRWSQLNHNKYKYCDTIRRVMSRGLLTISSCRDWAKSSASSRETVASSICWAVLGAARSSLSKSMSHISDGQMSCVAGDDDSDENVDEQGLVHGP